MTDLSRSPGKYFRQLESSGDTLLVIKNSEIKYAVMNIETYKKLIEAEELFENSQIAEILKERAVVPKEEYLEVDIDEI
ncbi:Phd_YefM [Mesotoga prima MesG1.Ag.4.2]|uniref:Phd_YefM n=1 Tax=Mesotoga prima MesG1.Ag.4.2 TaxID=660470 RepID=I2F4N9_9BACT|nr:hypothetical protein [Mesotoga prima]AFK06892.1 Phd_YefM [Mesotoga prima MesG1.Ag.4.2]